MSTLALAVYGSSAAPWILQSMTEIIQLIYSFLYLLRTGFWDINDSINIQKQRSWHSLYSKQILPNMTLVLYGTNNNFAMQRSLFIVLLAKHYRIFVFYIDVCTQCRPYTTNFNIAFFVLYISICKTFTGDKLPFVRVGENSWSMSLEFWNTIWDILVRNIIMRH